MGRVEGPELGPFDEWAHAIALEGVHCKVAMPTGVDFGNLLVGERIPPAHGLRTWMYMKSAGKFCWAGPRYGLWYDGGIAGIYDVPMLYGEFARMVASLSGDINSLIRLKDAAGRIYSLLGFARAFYIFRDRDFLLQDSVSWVRASVVTRERLQKLQNTVKVVQKLWGVREEYAERLSFFVSRDISWSQWTETLEMICPEGPLSHDMSLEDALFVVHVNTCEPEPWESSWWRNTQYLRERPIHAKYLLSALAVVLKAEGALASDFGFHCSSEMTSETMVLYNIVRFLGVLMGL